MSKVTCENSCPLSISKLKKLGFFGGYRSGTVNWRSIWSEKSIGVAVSTFEPKPFVRLTYSTDGKTINYQVELTTTICNYGGVRYWFICLAFRGSVPCRKRVAVLYISGQYFACRRCCDLAYASQQESRKRMFGLFGDYLRLADKIEARENKIRVKYWKGQPTKRYAKLIRKSRALETYENNLISSEIT